MSLLIGNMRASIQNISRHFSTQDLTLSSLWRKKAMIHRVCLRSCCRSRLTKTSCSFTFITHIIESWIYASQGDRTISKRYSYYIALRHEFVCERVTSLRQYWFIILSSLLKHLRSLNPVSLNEIAFKIYCLMLLFVLHTNFTLCWKLLRMLWELSLSIVRSERQWWGRMSFYLMWGFVTVRTLLLSARDVGFAVLALGND